jgi:uncharacterized protein (TIGR02466 family)
MNEKDIFPLFSVPVYKRKLDIALSDDELRFIKAQGSHTQALGSKLSDDKFVLERPELQRLKDMLLVEVKEYFNNFLQYEFEIYFTNSWINKINFDEQQTLHNHANSIVSGIFYINVEDSMPSISFVNHKPHLLLNMRAKNYNIFNSVEFDLPVENNTVVLFPSSCFHYVKKNLTDNDRISIAFNTFVKGRIGVETAGGDLFLN